jgi:hypothetical protein
MNRRDLPDPIRARNEKIARMFDSENLYRGPAKWGRTVRIDDGRELFRKP